MQQQYRYMFAPSIDIVDVESTVTLVALSMGTAFGGAVITETVFAWPGLGFLLADAIFKGDYNVVRALLMISAALIIFFNLVADIAYSLVDPRVSY
jgi:peptide/nickel transport system permease protein